MGISLEEFDMEWQRICQRFQLLEQQEMLQLPSEKRILDVTSKAKPRTSDLAEALREIQSTRETEILSVPWESLIQEHLQYEKIRKLFPTPEQESLPCNVGAVVLAYTFSRDPRYGGIPIEWEMPLLCHAVGRLVNEGIVVAWNSQFKPYAPSRANKEPEGLTPYGRTERIIHNLCQGKIQRVGGPATEAPSKEVPMDHGYLYAQRQLPGSTQEKISVPDFSNNLLG
jgi:hypothetical protein